VAGLYHFLQQHAPEVTAEVRESYTATMSGVYLSKVRDYLSGLLAFKLEVASKSDLLGEQEWNGYGASLFTSRPSHARGDGAFRLGERRAVLDQIGEPCLVLPAARQAGTPLHYELIFRSVSTLLLDVVTSEHDFMVKFFGDADAFDNVFGKCIFYAMENLEQHLVRARYNTTRFIYISFCLSVYLSIYIVSIYLSISKSTSTSISVCPSILLTIYLSVGLSIHIVLCLFLSI